MFVQNTGTHGKFWVSTAFYQWRKTDRIQNKILCEGSFKWNFKLKLTTPAPHILPYMFSHCIFGFQHTVMQI